MNTTPAAFIVDDDPEFRRLLSRLLASVGIASEEYSHADAFLAAVDPAKPGCLLLDVRMPGLSGLDLQAELEQRGVVLPIVFISAHADLDVAVQAMKAGAVDFVQKPVREQDLLDRVHRALARDAELRRARQEKDAVQRRFETLTARECEVFLQVVTGKPNKAIAFGFGISEKTVKFHRAQVMRKMGAESLAALVMLAQTLESTKTNVPTS